MVRTQSTRTRRVPSARSSTGGSGMHLSKQLWRWEHNIVISSRSALSRRLYQKSRLAFFVFIFHEVTLSVIPAGGTGTVTRRPAAVGTMEQTASFPKRRGQLGLKRVS